MSEQVMQPQTQQQPDFDQLVNERVSQRVALTFGSIMLDKLRAEEENVVLTHRLAQLEKANADLLEQLGPQGQKSHTGPLGKEGIVRSFNTDIEGLKSNGHDVNGG